MKVAGIVLLILLTGEIIYLHFGLQEVDTLLKRANMRQKKTCVITQLNTIEQEKSESSPDIPIKSDSPVTSLPGNIDS
jgi:hypothetical protein